MTPRKSPRVKVAHAPPGKSRRRRAKPVVDTQWFHDQLASRKISIRALGRLLNIDASLVSRRLKGDILMTAQDIEDICTVVGIDFDEALRRAGARRGSPIDKTSVLWTVAHDGSMTRRRRAASVETPGTGNGGEGAQVAAPESALHGWVFMFDGPAQRIDPAAVGRMAVIGDREDNVRLGLLEHGARRGTWRVRDMAGRVAEAAAVAWAAPVTWAFAS